MSGKVNVDKSEMKQGSSLLNLNEVAETVGDWNKLLDEEEQKVNDGGKYILLKETFFGFLIV
jgi:hypothetical protein